jgi:hypothetical protein
MRPVAGACVLLLVTACANGGDARFPKRPDGCDVTLFHETPTLPTENIGPVQARCGDDIPKDDCVRTLKDAVCALGGDVVWGVDEPQHVDGKYKYSGRAAHSKPPPVPTPPATP